jgi:hypothetical protein
MIYENQGQVVSTALYTTNPRFESQIRDQISWKVSMCFHNPSKEMLE